jgi:hypothetical protein
MSYDRNDADKNYVSVAAWVGILILMAIPLVNLIAMFVLAFAGENDSRKNYFKAMLFMIGGIIALAVAISYSGHWPEIQRWLEQHSSPRK